MPNHRARKLLCGAVRFSRSTTLKMGGALSLQRVANAHGATFVAGGV